MAKVIGLVMGDEPLVVQALRERIDAEPGVLSEQLVIGGTAERHLGKHDVIFDRMSHLVPHYRSYLRAAALAGANVVNDPFAVVDDKFFALSLAARLGLNVPRSVLLPQKSYGHGVDPSRMLGNLQYPLRWDDVGHYTGFPASLREARPTGMEAKPVRDVGGVIGAYDHTWDSPTMLVADVHGEQQRLCCVCVGGADVVTVERSRSGDGVPDAVRREAEQASLEVSQALGLSLNAVEVVVTATKAWVVDALEPVPRLAPHILGADAFDDVIDHLAAHLIDCARRHERTIDAHAWAQRI